MSLTQMELDRLADYTVDALDPRDAAQVADLVRTDARWAEAYQSLLGADVRVRADLRQVAARPVAMPAEVVARIDSALAAVPTVGPAQVIRLDAARSRRRRVFAAVAAAAAAVVVIGGGLSFVTYNRPVLTDTASAPEAARDQSDYAGGLPVAPPTAMAGGPRVMSSGTNYARSTLSQLATDSAAPWAAHPDSALKAGEVPQEVREAAPSPLSRLTEPAGLSACLRSVLASHPGTVSALDYARFEDEPALVIVIRHAAGSVVVAVGRECGTNGTAEKAAVQV